MTKKDDEKLLEIANMGADTTDAYDTRDLDALRAVAYYAFWEGVGAGMAQSEDEWRQKRRIREAKAPWVSTVPDAH